MSILANFEVYLQALGGKFIGQNAFMPSQIKVHIFANGVEHPLPYFSSPTNPPDDGEVGAAYFDGLSSVVPILTNNPIQAVVPVTVNFLTPQPNITVVAQKDIEIENVNETAELVVYYPVPGPNNTVKTLTLRQPMLLNAFQTSYKTIVVIPGLLVHTPVLFGNQVTAVVTMMCGCKVSNGSTPPYWLPSDFTVMAHVAYKNQPTVPVTMSIQESGATSTFVCSLTTTYGIDSITVIATQKSTANFGFNRLNFG